VHVGTFDVGHAVSRENGGDAYVAFESVMRVHARDGDWRRGLGEETVRSTKRKLLWGGEEKRSIREMWNQRNRKGEEIKVRLES